MERKAVDIIQPDCTKNGGLSESRQIAWLAYDHNVQVVPPRLEHCRRLGRRSPVLRGDSGCPLRRVSHTLRVPLTRLPPYRFVLMIKACS
ncbi:MAG: hypothetical protein JO114_16950 [Planctomycetaceae bacterium]|nr:hypothetical protein [Planctomycetaceae bacterium]MBV8313209.1 hypothetical protein [Planctomycetaceae bacterium]